MFYACLYIDCGLPPGGSPLNIQRYLRPSPDPPGACLAYSFSSQSPLSRIQPQTHPKRKRYRIPKNIYASLIPSSINKKCYPTFSPNSFNCLESTCVGASVKRQLHPGWTLTLLKSPPAGLCQRPHRHAAGRRIQMPLKETQTSFRPLGKLNLLYQIFSSAYLFYEYVWNRFPA